MSTAFQSVITILHNIIWEFQRNILHPVVFPIFGKNIQNSSWGVKVGPIDCKNRSEIVVKQQHQHPPQVLCSKNNPHSFNA